MSGEDVERLIAAWNERQAKQMPMLFSRGVHILEAGFDPPDRRLVLMLHGFPEIDYSWRKLMPSVAAAGFHVVAPDLRGYRRTTGWIADYDADLRPFRLLNAVRDTLGKPRQRFFA